MFSGQHGDAQIVRRLSVDHVGRTGRRLQQLERDMHQIAVREVPDIRVGSNTFPATPRQGQLVWRSDLSPAGWYQYDAGSGNWNAV